MMHNYGNFVTTPTTTQHNLNTEVGLDMKMTLHTPSHPDMGVCARGCPIPFFMNFNLRDFFFANFGSTLLLDLKFFYLLTQAKTT